MDNSIYVRRPNSVERIFNALFGLCVGMGLGLRHNYLLEVRGRKTGKLYATPVDLLEADGRRYLVAGRGRVNWVRNAEAAGRVTLRRGASHSDYTVRAVSAADKPEILRRYLDRFKLTVKQFFPVPPGSPAEAFAPLADRYPVFELIPAAASDQAAH